MFQNNDRVCLKEHNLTKIESQDPQAFSFVEPQMQEELGGTIKTQ